jgi:hypothetical protein
VTSHQVVPIGWVESSLTDRAQAPRQGDEGAPSAWLVFEPGSPTAFATWPSAPKSSC